MDELIIQLGDAHVYRDHIDALKEQLKRESRLFPKLRWARKGVIDIEYFEYHRKFKLDTRGMGTADKTSNSWFQKLY